MHYRVLCTLGSAASVGAICAIAQHKYHSGSAIFVSVVVSLLGLTSLLALAAAVIGPHSGNK